MFCVVKCIVHGNQARVKNADLRHLSCTVVMHRHKSASPVLSALRSPCFNKWGSGGEQLASNMGLLSTLSPSCCSDLHQNQSFNC